MFAIFNGNGDDDDDDDIMYFSLYFLILNVCECKKELFKLNASSEKSTGHK